MIIFCAVLLACGGFGGYAAARALDALEWKRRRDAMRRLENDLRDDQAFSI